MPKISVIIPVYNAEKYLRECIASVLNQTFKDFEVLIINDGSKDGSGWICDSYELKDSRVKVFHKENGGVSSARNLGLDKATGEWICFVDSDDWVSENYLSDLYELTVNTKFDLVIHGFNRVLNNETQQISVGEGVISNQNTYEIFEKHNLNMFGYPFAKLFNREIIFKNKLTFYNNLRLGEDQLFLISYLANSNKIVLQKKYNYNYIIRQGSLSGSTDLDQFKLRYLCMKESLFTHFPDYMNNLFNRHIDSKNMIETFWIRLFGTIKLLYILNEPYNNRVNYLKNLDMFDKLIIKHSIKNSNIVIKSFFKLIELKQFYLADSLLITFYKLKNQNR